MHTGIYTLFNKLKQLGTSELCLKLFRRNRRLFEDCFEIPQYFPAGYPVDKKPTFLTASIGKMPLPVNEIIGVRELFNIMHFEPESTIIN
jgi:hypothetical protein